MVKKVVCSDMDGKEYEVSTSELSWRPAAYGVVIKDNKILLLKQYNGYDLPGGGIDFGEMPETAVLREIKEESGIDAVKPELIDVASSFFKRFGVGDYIQSISLYYKCEYDSGEISNEGLEEHEKQYAEGCRWVPVEKLDEIVVAAATDWRVYVKRIIGV